MTMPNPSERSTAKQARNMFGVIKRDFGREAKRMRLTTDRVEGNARRRVLN